MIDSVWLDKILALVDRPRGAKEVANLAERLGDPNEVLPYLATRERAFKGWGLTSAALKRAGKAVARPTLSRAADPATGWETSEERPDLIARMHALVKSRDIGWRPEMGERGPYVGEVVRLVNNHRRLPNSSAAPSSFIQAGGYVDRFRSGSNLHQAFGDESLSSIPADAEATRQMGFSVGGAPSRGSEVVGKITRVMMTRPAWWGFMPARWRWSALLRVTEKKGLFNGALYLERYPDVASAGANPLQHFLYHGASEGRLS